MGIHGGDIYRNRVKLDFSISVNPLGTPECIKEALHRAVAYSSVYPDIASERLKDAVSQALAVPAEYVLFGNGASELFMAVVHAVMPKKIVIPVPSFYGYEYAAKAAGSRIVFYTMRRENGFCLDESLAEELEQLLDREAGLLFLANPNNPVGNLLNKETICRLLRHCHDKGIYVVLDECFIDFCGSRYSMLSELDKMEASRHLVLVRAFTKSFAIPGVRLGYLVCKDRRLCMKIAGQLPEWNLSVFAQKAGILCAGQTAFLQATQRYVKKEREFLQEGLRRRGLRVFPSAANFIMVSSGAPIYEKLLEQGILIRDCSNFRGLGKGDYRIAVRSREENEALLEHLS